LHWRLPNSARNLAEAEFGRIWEKWPNFEFAEAEAEIRCNPNNGSSLLVTFNIMGKFLEASCCCDCSLERFVLHQLHGLSRCDTRDVAELMDPGGKWSTTVTSPFLRRHLAIFHLGGNIKDLIVTA